MQRIVFTFLLVVLSMSCTDNDDNFDTALTGTWVLTDVSCFCGFGDNPDFSGHTLTFQGDNLSIANTGEFKFLIDADGTFSNDGSSITLNNGQQYRYEIKGNILELTFVDNPQIADDELFLVYRRPEN